MLQPRPKLFDGGNAGARCARRGCDVPRFSFVTGARAVRLAAVAIHAPLVTAISAELRLSHFAFLQCREPSRGCVADRFAQTHKRRSREPFAIRSMSAGSYAQVRARAVPGPCIRDRALPERLLAECLHRCCHASYYKFSRFATFCFRLCGGFLFRFLDGSADDVGHVAHARVIAAARTDPVVRVLVSEDLTEHRYHLAAPGLD